MIDASRVLVCGGRDYADYDRVDDILSRVGPSMVITGTYLNPELYPHLIRGADQLAVYWARMAGVPSAICEANWKKFGRGAGPIRNEAMLLLQPTLVIAFPGGTGTAGMCKLAEEAGVRVMKVRD